MLNTVNWDWLLMTTTTVLFIYYSIISKVKSEPIKSFPVIDFYMMCVIKNNE